MKDGLEILERLRAGFTRLVADLRQDLRGDVDHADYFTIRRGFVAKRQVSTRQDPGETQRGDKRGSPWGRHLSSGY